MELGRDESVQLRSKTGLGYGSFLPHTLIEPCQIPIMDANYQVKGKGRLL
jgi:hypothetical protein